MLEFKTVMERSIQLRKNSYKRLEDPTDLDKLAICEVITKTQNKKGKLEDILEKSREVEDSGDETKVESKNGFRAPPGRPPLTPSQSAPISRLSPMRPTSKLGLPLVHLLPQCLQI